MTFTWLHLSDLHWGTTDTENYWGNIEANLYNDIRFLKDTYDLKYDVIFFTGDLVNRGTEYEQLNARLTNLKTQLAVMDIKPLLLPVPGNHDLVRPDKNDDSFQVIRDKWETDESIRNRIWNKQTDTSTWKLLQGAFTNYMTWWRGYKPFEASPFPRPVGIKEGLLPGDFAFTFKKEGKSIGIIGLNSALLHLGDESCGKLELHAAQLRTLCDVSYQKWFDGHDACFLLTHHPVSWLSPRGKEAFTNEIAREGRFLLHSCGHLHENGYAEWSEGFHAAKRRTLQGTALFSKEPYTYVKDGKSTPMTERRHGYSAGKLIFEPGAIRMTIWPRTVNKKLDFVVDTDLCEKGEKAEIMIPVERIIPPPPSGTDEEIRQLIKEKISALLALSGMEIFCRYLIEAVEEIKEKSCSREELAGLLVNENIRDAIVLLKLTFKKVKDFAETDRTAPLPVKIWEKTVEILGWLILSLVDREWLDKNKGLRDKENKIFRLEIAARGVIGIEAAVSALEVKPAEYELDKEGRVCSKKKIGEDFLEAGFDPGDIVEGIKREIYKVLFKRDAPRVYTAKEDKELNALLDFRNRCKEHHYLVIGKNLKETGKGICDKLLSALPALNVVWLQMEGDNNVLILTEESLNSYIWDFLQDNP